jgi:hypothetical protein
MIVTRVCTERRSGMVYVVFKEDGKILNSCDAWEQDAEGKMRRWCKNYGYVITDVRITSMGDMVLSVEDAKEIGA